jgi:hypothetical protein
MCLCAALCDAVPMPVMLPDTDRRTREASSRARRMRSSSRAESPTCHLPTSCCGPSRAPVPLSLQGHSVPP